MTDMSSVIVPRSDQLNSDDLWGGPRTITISKVAIKPGTEQPVAISFEGDEGRPWKPCKTSCRILVALWGPDAKAYAGRSLTLYRDPDVTWAGMKVGGIRISNMSDIEREHTMALTVTKQSRKPYTVKPLRTQQQPAERAKQPASTPEPQSPEQSLAEQLDHLEPDEWKQPEGRVEDERQAKMMPAREWTLESATARGKEIAAALKDHGDKPGDKLDNLEGVWTLYSAEIMTMPLPVQKGLRTVYDEQRKSIEESRQASK